MVIQRPEKRCSYKCVEHRLSSNLFKELTDNIDSWSYDRLDEVNRIAPIIKEKMKKN